MDLKSLLASQSYGSSGTSSANTAERAKSGSDPSGMVQDFTETLRENETVAKAALSGQADPEALVQALAETQLAVETAVTVRDKVVEAYQEILRMPV